MADLSIGQAYKYSQPARVGIEGYYVQSKYLDPKKMKEERDRVEALSKG